MNVATAYDRARWKARLRLGFKPIPEKTVLAERERFGPLAVQRAFYPEGDLCHVYLLHPPGGVAGGDELEIDVHVAPGAAALLTTPGATKFYHSLGPEARLLQRLAVEQGALEWLPQENILFPGAKIALTTRVELTREASFIGWEINCLGRPVIDEKFNRGSALFNFQLLRDGEPLLLERQTVSASTPAGAAAGLRGNPVFASLYATLDDSSHIDRLRQEIPPAQRHSVGITQLDGLLVARYLGGSAADARELFVKLWHVLRPLMLDRRPCTPRIWNT